MIPGMISSISEDDMHTVLYTLIWPGLPMHSTCFLKIRQRNRKSVGHNLLVRK